MLNAYGDSPLLLAELDDHSAQQSDTQEFGMDAGESETADANLELQTLPLEEIRQIRNDLKDLENRVSYWRRIIQARLDLLRDGSISRGATVEGLSRVLSKHLGPNNRKAVLTVNNCELPPLEGLARLWKRGITENGEDPDTLEEDLAIAENELSTRRSELHEKIDAATAELILRYREDPARAFSLLPTRPSNPTPL